MFDSKNGIYWDIKIDKQDPGFDINVLSDLTIKSSIFDLFPTVSFKLANQKNSFCIDGYCKAGAKLDMEIGSAEDNDNSTLDQLKDFVLDKPFLTQGTSALDSKLHLNFVNQNVSVRSLLNFRR